MAVVQARYLLHGFAHGMQPQVRSRGTQQVDLSFGEFAELNADREDENVHPDDGA